MSEKVDDAYYYRAKTPYVEYVSKGAGKPEELAKAIRAELLLGEDYQTGLDRLLSKVETESVVSFEQNEAAAFRSQAAARRARFEEVKRILLSGPA